MLFMSMLVCNSNSFKSKIVFSIVIWVIPAFLGYLLLWLVGQDVLTRGSYLWH